jgi:hypothetical protein
MKDNSTYTNQIKQEDVESKIIKIRGRNVILDSDIATLYSVETRDINKAVKNNPDKLPKSYLFQVNKAEKLELVEIFHRLNNLKHSTASPKAFTEKGLYMLATILKSKKATKTTISIIETFSKVKEISKTIRQIPALKEKAAKQQTLIERTGELISDLIVTEGMDTSESEATIELNLVVVKFKYSVKKEKK